MADKGCLSASIESQAIMDSYGCRLFSAAVAEMGNSIS